MNKKITDESIAARIIKRIDKRVKFSTREKFLGLFKVQGWASETMTRCDSALGLVEDQNGVDVKRFNDWTPMSPKGCIEGHLVSSVRADCITRICKEKGPKDGTVEDSTLERKWDFNVHSKRTNVCTMVTDRQGFAHAVTTSSKFLNHKILGDRMLSTGG